MNTHIQITIEEKAPESSVGKQGSFGYETVISSLYEKLDSEQMGRLTKISPAGYAGDE
ncbi:hypothetical protein [Methanolobus bombayensis]|uniref:hypothetical protein n=1 Tax=Methanolobus bombayensis TaxID=38023 RepID=UPI001AE7CEE1|nr:hypothetical protein [Methanolobus bombayensis]MBP1909733.1 hypothetical protein [Methanolobus bombayensis]